MAIPLRVLVVEDSEDDALLVTRELERGGFDLSIERVETREAMAEALDRGPWDLIVSDFSMPRFSAVEALALYRERGIETPFILVSGTVGDEQAVESLKAGACDFFLKDRLTRLCPAVKRELREAENRRTQRRAEEALRTSEARFKDAFASSPIGMALVALDGRWLEVNPVLCRIVGYPEEELLARTFQDITHPDDLETDLAFVSQMLSGEIPSYQMEKRYLHKTGRVIWARLSVSLPRDQAGRPQYFISQIQDITEERRTEQALRLQAAALNAAANSVVITDRAGVIEWVNPAFTRITGYAPEEALGANPRILKSGMQEPAFYLDLWTTIRAGRTFQGEIVNRRKDGGLYTQELTIAPVHDTAGEVTHFVAIGQDVSERKLAEQGLRASLREKEALLKEVHHRVKNNLQIITSLLRIEGRRAAAGVTKSVLAQMQDRIQSMALLHETLYRSGNFAGVGLDSYLTQLAHQLFRSALTKPGQVRLNLDLVPVFVEIDKAIPCGLIANELVTNSLKHAFPDGRPGEVTIRLRRAGDGETLVLSVSDDGAGLPADVETKRRGSLGLQLVSDLARQLQGRLDIPQPPAATFTLTFNPAPARVTMEIPPPDGRVSER